ncbi:hypothetical protein D3C81_2019240 [compost metagenome]
MQVQNGGAGVVAFRGLVDLLLHGDRDVFRKVGRHPLGAVRRHGDDHLVHVFHVQGIVQELHSLVSSIMGAGDQMGPMALALFQEG